MEISLLCPRTPGQIAQLCALWEASVRATHHFLQEEDIRRIAGLVPEALEQVPRLLVACREERLENTPPALQEEAARWLAGFAEERRG